MAVESRQKPPGMALGDLPDWAKEPFRHFLKDLLQAHKVYHLTLDGISIIHHSFARREELEAQLEKLYVEMGEKREQGPSKAEERESARERAEWAEAEAKGGFPIIHAHGVVELWGSIEALVRELLAAWLANQPGALQVEAVRKVRVRLAEFQAMSSEERYDYLVGELERNVATGLKGGVRAFEALLEPFGLSGPVDKATGRKLFELCQVRNVIVHRRGAADKRLAEACPWLGLKPGAQVRVGFESYHGYVKAVDNYQKILTDRVRRRLTASRTGRPVTDRARRAPKGLRPARPRAPHSHGQ